MDLKVLGNKIASARKENNMSQAQLAQLLFISPQAVGKWERGESVPDFFTINKLSEIFRVDLNYFSGNQHLSENLPTAPISGVTLRENAESPEERYLLTNFNGSALAETDFSGVVAPKRKFFGSNLQRTDFSEADLTGSAFKGSDVRGSNFKGTNLTDCTLTASNFTDAEFFQTIIIRTEFIASELSGAKFTETRFIDSKLKATDLRKTIFENCEFNGVDFKASDMDGLCFEGFTFINVKFDNASLKNTSFKGATLRNVSFRPTFALTNKFYKSLQTINFEGASMDKLTYAALKGMGVNLSKALVM
ncbi:pentapeptide repeat-containing protein [Chryseobacterium flavum]|uniref:pentapeptide repeat-containing protein n=1 Tax=Chryseobacterium flavum TaxID=415851 RepID=UPI0028ADB668|nr:pentapeptide repeat-containing protein [Chryseobacterium flavum]